MASLGMTPTAVGVAEAYADFLDVLVIDEEDRALAPAVEATGVRAVVTHTIMRGPAEKRALAQTVLAAAAAEICQVSIDRHHHTQPDGSGAELAADEACRLHRE